MSAEQFLKGRHALVTGASRGIGFAIATALANAGANVSLLARQSDSLAAAQTQTPRSYAVSCDLLSASQTQSAVDSAIKAHGPVSILVNNAGAAKSVAFQRSTDEDWEQMLGVNLLPAVRLTRVLSESLLSSPNARVIQVASTAALTGYSYVSAYCAAKHALLGFTRALAREWAQHDVTVNALCPGYTETGLARDAIQNIVEKTGRTVEAARASLTRSNPQARFIQAEEVAAAALWLCRPESRSITGQAISISGGEVLAA
jgi:NAD(P)-dependent dehydrogenase (short-subunit alcohol dehydrogenase family)